MADEDETAPGGKAPAPAQSDEHVKAFFLDLAAKGKDAWNVWRRDPVNEYVCVTFAGVDFSNAPLDTIDFSGFEFGDDADFSGCIFGDGTSFENATFGEGTRFVDAIFCGAASFEGTTFGPRTVFRQTHFMGRVKFNGGVIRSSEEAPRNFLEISFANAHFHEEADFSIRDFRRPTDFTNAHFYSPPNIDTGSKVGRIDFTDAHIGFAPRDKFLHWTTDSRIPIRLRALRKIVEDTKNHDLERDLYIEERKAERGVYWHQRLEELKKEGWKSWPRNATRLAIHGLWIIVMLFYWALSNYGRSFIWPAILLGLSVPFFYWRYSKVLAPLMHEAGPANADKYDHAARMLALGNAVPFVGPLTIDSEIKRFLFCPGFGPCVPIPPEGFQCWVVLQNVVSIILVFFIGLALRNYFKIK